MNNNRILVLLAAAFIGVGGVGMNSADRFPDKLYFEIALGIGVIIFAIVLVLKQREQNKKNS